MKSAESLHVAHHDQGLPRPDGSHEMRDINGKIPKLSVQWESYR